MPDLILYNGKISTFDADTPHAEAAAVTGGKLESVGSVPDIMATASDAHPVAKQLQVVFPGP